jgi:dienelactone hydrolase
MIRASIGCFGPRRLFRYFVVAFALLLALPVAGAEPVRLVAADGVTVFAELWRAPAANAPIIVAFHQADSSSAEYAPIARRVVAAGFSVLAIDQRSGDGAFGGTNRTVEALGRSTDYDHALPDLEAALVWATGHANGAPVIAWGSSYSAALVFVLAASHPGKVSGIVAFSPGEYLANPNAVREAASRIDVPVYIDQASSAEEVKQSAAILRALHSADKQQLRSSAASTHGSSTLRADTNTSGAQAHWAPLLAFLARFQIR